MTAVAIPPATFLVGDDVPDFLKGVEIVSAGMDWPTANGAITVTLEHIADAVIAANDDPHIQVPRVRLGHTSSLNGDQPRFDPFAAFGDAEPAFGRYTNLRATNDGAVLVGDVTDIPAWLGEGAPTLFPNRSMECMWDVVTEGGKRYSMVVTAVSFLGAYLPACRDLEDLARLTAGGPAALRAAQLGRREETRMDELSVSADTIRQRFNYEWSTAEPIDGMDTYWWWARDIRVDPSEVIADDDEGNLWSVPFTTDGADNVTFDQPVRVRQTYVPTAAAASFTRPRKGAKPNAASARPTTEKEPTMDVDTTLLRRRLGLSEDATEEQITEALAAEESPETPPEGDDPRAAAEPVPAAASTAVPEVAADTVTVSRQVWDETNSRIDRLEATERERNEAAATRRRDDAASAAVGDGRITPAERDHYRSMLDIDERGTVELLGTLTAGRVPMHQRGEIPSTERQPGAASAGDSGIDTSLLTNRQVAEMRDRGLIPETSR